MHFRIYTSLNCLHLIYDVNTKFTTHVQATLGQTQRKGKVGNKVDNSPSLFVDFSSDRPAGTESYTSL